MDVRGPASNRIGQEAIDQAYDGRFLDLGLQLHRGECLFLLLHDLDVLFLELLEQVSQPVVRNLVVLVDRHAQRVFAGDYGVDVEPGDELQVVDYAQVGRVDHGNGKRTSDAPKWKDQVLGRKVGGHQLEDFGVDLYVRKVYRRNSVLPGQEPRELRFGHRSG